MASITIKTDIKLNKILLLLQASGAALIISDGSETEITALEGYKEMVLYSLEEARAVIKSIATL